MEPVLDGLQLTRKFSQKIRKILKKLRLWTKARPSQENMNIKRKWTKVLKSGKFIIFVASPVWCLEQFYL